jgi:hypothetical protein
MTDHTNRDQPEFIRLAGHAVRVTSLSRDDQAGTYRMVTITRGSRDAQLLADILAEGRVPVEIPGEDATELQVADIDRRDFGEGQSAIARFSVTLSPPDINTPAMPTTETRSLEERVEALETDVRQLRLLVQQLANATSA